MLGKFINAHLHGINRCLVRCRSSFTLDICTPQNWFEKKNYSKESNCFETIVSLTSTFKYIVSFVFMLHILFFLPTQYGNTFSLGYLVSSVNVYVLTVWKVCKYGVVSGSYFPIFRLKQNTFFGHFSHSVYLHVQYITSSLTLVIVWLILVKVGWCSV